MNYKIHKLNSRNHSHVIGRQDAVTGDLIQANDNVVFCSACQSVFLVESWEYMNQKHCNQTETLDFIPAPLPVLKAKKKTKEKNDKLIFEFEPKETIFNQIYPSTIGPLFISVGIITDYSLFYILPCIISYLLIVLVTVKGLKRKKVRDFFKLDKKAIRILETGIELQNDRFYFYSEIEKIEYVKQKKVNSSKILTTYLIIHLKNGEIIKQDLPFKSYEKTKPFLVALAGTAKFINLHFYTQDTQERKVIESIEQNYVGRILIENDLELDQNNPTS